MKLIVGLGNPGNEYSKTRHNVGFCVIDKLIEELKIDLDKNKFKAIYGIYKVIIMKPLTYMNLSGEAVLAIKNFYDIDVKDIIVVHDDLDLPVGKLRLRKSGSSGGQKGMGNIIALLNKNDINRIGIGIGNNKLIDTADYVLGRFNEDDLKIINEAYIKAKDALIYSLDHDFEDVMSKFN